MELIFASHNENKVKEVRKILGKEFKIISLNEIGFYDEIPENQPTIEGNAKFKSQYIFEKYNLNVFADDTGLEIKALNNEPGVRSARYAGDHKNSTDNINKVLKELDDFEDRSAKFKTVFSLITKDFSKLFTGIIYGEITKEVNGSKGFGYDPIFKPNGYSMTFGEIDSRIKNQISHRALATNKLVDFLRKVYD
jgi:XTP/dITP diphosphohydrolase